jgi:hypothetical protein
MSDAPQRSSTRPSKNQSDSRRKRGRRGGLIRVAAEDRGPSFEPFLIRLRRNALWGAGGLAASFAIHLLLLLIMTLIVVRGVGPDAPDELVGVFSEPESQSAKPTVGPLRVPGLTVAPEQNRPQEPSPSRPKPEAATSPDASNPPVVKPIPIGGMLDSRNPRLRDQVLGRQGGGTETERAVAAGLMWLKRQQRSSGSWSLHEGYPDAGYRTAQTATGATSLALLAFLGAGHTPDYGEHAEVVRKGVNWLKGMQRPDGNLFDIDELGRMETYYAHSMATIVLCEAYAMTRDESLREPADRAVAFLLDSQHPTKGGWKYRKQTRLTKGDLSVTGWALMALHTARIAGLDVPAEAFTRASVFLDSVEEAGGARYKYDPDYPASKASAPMTAVGLLCRQWLGWPRDYWPLEAGVRHLLQPEHRPEWSAGRRNVYHWYYTTQVLHNLGGENWEHWFADLSAVIVENQVKTGSTRAGSDIRGSWHPTNPPGAPLEYSQQAGRLYVTALCLLILETPYRHVSVYAAE